MHRLNDRGRFRPPGWGGIPGLFLLLGLLAACGTERPEGVGPVVTRRVAPDPPAVTRSKIGQAESLVAHGDYAGALAGLQRALAGAGDNALRDRIQQMRLRLKRRVLAEVLKATVATDRDRIVAGGSLDVILKLRNLGAVEIEIPRIDYRRRLLVFRKEMGRSVIDLTFRLEEFDARGSRRTEQFNEFVEPREDIRLAPGGEWSQVCRIDPERIRYQTAFTARLTAACLKRLTIEALIRPVRIKLGEQDFFTTIRCRPHTVYVLPRGSEVMFDEPLRHLELALLRAGREPRFLPHVLVASSLLSGEASERGRQALLRCRDRGAPVLRPLAGRALELFWPEPAAAPTPAPADVTFK